MTNIQPNTPAAVRRNIEAAELLRAGDLVESHGADWHNGLEGEVVSVVGSTGIVLVDFGDDAQGRGHDGTSGKLGGSKWFCRAGDLEVIEDEEDDEDFEYEAQAEDAQRAEDPREAAMFLAGDMLKVAQGMPYGQTKAAVALAFFTICIADPANTTPAKAMASMLELTLRGEGVVRSIFDNVKQNTVVGPKH